MLSFLGAAKASAVGPKQQACLSAGGTWMGPVGKKKCVGGGAAGPVPLYIVGGTGGPTGILPKAGSTAYGPIPAQFVGTEKTGSAGPKQTACQTQGGHWIGPEGGRWCQITGQPLAVPVAGGTAVPYGAPVSTAMVPPGADILSSGAGSGLPSVGGGNTLTPEMLMQPGLQPDSLTAGGTAVGSGSPSLMTEARQYALPGLALAGIAVVAYFMLKGKRGRSGRSGGRSRRPARHGKGIYRTRARARRSHARRHAKVHAPVQLPKPVV